VKARSEATQGGSLSPSSGGINYLCGSQFLLHNFLAARSRCFGVHCAPGFSPMCTSGQLLGSKKRVVATHPETAGRWRVAIKQRLSPSEVFHCVPRLPEAQRTRCAFKLKGDADTGRGLCVGERRPVPAAKRVREGVELRPRRVPAGQSGR